MGSIRAVVLAATVAASLAAPAPGSAQGEAAVLRQLISEIETERKIVFSPFGNVSLSSLYVLDRDQVGAIAGYQVASGQLNPDSLESWTRKQIAFSRAAIQVMKEQLKRLEEGGGWSEPPAPAGPTSRNVPTAQVDPNAIYWPTPMAWTEVRGQIRGDYHVQCYYRDNRLPEIRGRFLLDFRGGGVVLGSYTDDRYTREANGLVQTDGQASGNGRTNESTIMWSARLTRSGNALVIEQSSLLLTPFESRGRCDPGVMDPD